MTFTNKDEILCCVVAVSRKTKDNWIACGVVCVVTTRAFDSESRGPEFYTRRAPDVVPLGKALPSSLHQT